MLVKCSRMVLRGIIITSSLLVALISFLGYVDVPDTIEDRYRAILFIAQYKLITVVPFQLSNLLGYGSYLDNMKNLGRLLSPNLNSPPKTASYGILNVTRAKLAGRDAIVYRPLDVAKDELLPGLVYFHGGGWSMHNPDRFDKSTHDIANCSRKVLISVDYRLAPAHPFPTPFQDCLDVTKHVLKHGKSLGINVNSVGVAGDSAGGNMAAAVTIALSREKNTGLPPLKLQILAFPATQAIDFQTPSFVELGERLPLLTAHRVGGFWASYLGLDDTKLDEYALILKYNRHVPPELLKTSKYAKYLDRERLPERFRKPRPEVMGNYYTSPEEAGVISSYDSELYKQIKDTLLNPLLAPLMASESELKGLPPALVIVGEFDLLRDDGLLYAYRLREAGVKTEVFINKGYHSDLIRTFPDFFHSRTGKKTVNAMCEFVKKEA